MQFDSPTKGPNGILCSKKEIILNRPKGQKLHSAIGA